MELSKDIKFICLTDKEKNTMRLLMEPKFTLATQTTNITTIRWDGTQDLTIGMNLAGIILWPDSGGLNLLGGPLDGFH